MMSEDADIGGEIADTVERTYQERHGNEPTGYQGQVRYEFEGLPPGIKPGAYQVTFDGMEYSVAGPPTIRFRYVGPAGQPPAADQAEAEGWLPGGHGTYRTKSGKIITPSMIEAWAAEAEAGYDVEELRELPTRHGAPLARPDLYQVSQVEILNVSKLARVITQLIYGEVISPESIGLMPDPESGLTPGVEQWLRS